VLSVGLDLHKKYLQVEALEESGERRAAARLVNEFEQIEGFFRALGEPCRVVLEAGWNWGAMYDWLERIENVVEVQLAHPYGVRAIAAAQVKTDRIDARMLGQLLRVGLIPRTHIPGRETRQLREAVRNPGTCRRRPVRRGLVQEYTGDPISSLRYDCPGAIRCPESEQFSAR
jgi:transposase